MAKLEHDIELLLAYIDNQVEKVAGVSTSLQSKIYDIVREELLKFEIKDGVLVPDQDLRKRLIELEDKIEAVLNTRIWDNTVNEFLSSYQTIQDRNVSMNRDYNQLEVDTKLLSPARRFIYDQALYALKTGIAPQYVQPVKFLLMQQVTAGASITESLKLLEKWDKGEASSGKYTSGMPAPDLKRYATQIARDSAYAVDRNISSIIKERYQLDHFMYVGGIVEDSRPLCKHLVSMGGEISFDELPELIKRYPQGLYPDTTKENFMQKVGGYACRHKAFAVRKRNAE